MKIIEVNHSIANRFDGYIEINKNLKKYPNLLKPILAHEKAHTDEPWSVKDFKLDFFSDNKVDGWELLKFMFKHPKSFSQISPILYSKKKGFIIDINLMIMYSIMVTVFALIIYTGMRFL